MSTVCVVGDVVYAAELHGYVHCLDARTGKRYWVYDTKATIWGSPYYCDGKVYVANDSGDLYVFRHRRSRSSFPDPDDVRAAVPESPAGPTGARRQLRKAFEAEVLVRKVEFDGPIRSTPTVAGGVLYVATEKTLTPSHGSDIPVTPPPADLRRVSAAVPAAGIPALACLAGRDSARPIRLSPRIRARHPGTGGFRKKSHYCSRCKSASPAIFAVVERGLSGNRRLFGVIPTARRTGFSGSLRARSSAPRRVRPPPHSSHPQTKQATQGHPQFQAIASSRADTGCPQSGRQIGVPQRLSGFPTSGITSPDSRPD